MPFCTSCRENVQFEERDGLFYCSFCLVQSETMQVLEYSEMPSQPQSQSFSALSQSRSLKIRKSKEKSASSTPAQDGKSKGTPAVESTQWWLAEVFQIILKAQVDALIDMGVTPKLREVVKQLWFKYLQKTKWAFHQSERERKKAKEVAEKKSCTPKGKQKDAQTPQTPKTPKNWKEGSKSPRKRRTVDKIPPSDSHILKDKRGHNVTGLRLPHLICIIYLALRWLREPILLSDLMRWALEGHLPYYASSQLLPKSIEKQFSTHESTLFSVARPGQLQSCKLLAAILQMIKLLGLPPLAPVNLQLVISRFILLLNLPADFHRFSHQLLHSHTIDLEAEFPRLNRPYNEEAPAMAYIVVAIKMMLGLDDTSEYRLSNIGRELWSKLPTNIGQQLFIWDEWVGSQILRARTHQLNMDHLNPKDIRQVCDANTFIRHHVNFYQLKLKKDHLYTKEKFHAKNMSNLIQRPFSALEAEDDVDDDHSGDSNKPSSFPFSMKKQNESCVEPTATTSSQEESMQDIFQSPTHSQSSSQSEDSQSMRHHHDHKSTITWMSKENLLSVDFSKHDTDYLVNLRKFCKKHEIELDGVSWHHGKRSIKGTDKRTMSSSDNSSVLSTLSYEEWKKQILESPSGSKQSNESVTAIPCPHEQYVRYNPTSYRNLQHDNQRDGPANDAVLDQFHESYLWLLKHCGALVGLKWTEIHEVVMVLEKELFD